MSDLRGERDSAIMDFLRAAGWAAAQRHKLPGDASFRRYERLALGSRHAMLMDAPPPREDVRPFLRVARHLTALGFSAPRIYEADETAGLLILEDLGDDTYTRLLARGADERELYALAIDVLIALHRVPDAQAIPAGLPPYDDKRLLDEAKLLVEWFMPAITGAPVPQPIIDEYVAQWQAVLPLTRFAPPTLVLRDYHVDNLMGLPEREGVAACGLLDFQDAVAGAAAYDVVSLLEDARRDLASGLPEAMMQRYLAAFPKLDRQAFASSAAILSAQRNAKIIGIFTRLSRRDGKHHYLKHIPRVWRLLEQDLAHSALKDVRAWFDRTLPAALRRAPPVPVTAA
jgi:aminoglycoside/choline kinase family phosphotransferase